MEYQFPITVSCSLCNFYCCEIVARQKSILNCKCRNHVLFKSPCCENFFHPKCLLKTLENNENKWRGNVKPCLLSGKCGYMVTYQKCANSELILIQIEGKQSTTVYQPPQKRKEELDTIRKINELSRTIYKNHRAHEQFRQSPLPDIPIHWL